MMQKCIQNFRAPSKISSSDKFKEIRFTIKQREQMSLLQQELETRRKNDGQNYN